MDHKTVGTVRTDLSERGEIPHVETTIDTLGREQPARKPMRTEFRDPSSETTAGVAHNALFANNIGLNPDKYLCVNEVL